MHFVYYFQVHPEGKFVVDVDKNIDINDVSIVVISVLLMLAKKHGVYPCYASVESLSGDSKLPCGSTQ